MTTTVTATTAANNVGNEDVNGSDGGENSNGNGGDEDDNDDEDGNSNSNSGGSDDDGDDNGNGSSGDVDEDDSSIFAAHTSSQDSGLARSVGDRSLACASGSSFPECNDISHTRPKTCPRPWMVRCPPPYASLSPGTNNAGSSNERPHAADTEAAHGENEGTHGENSTEGTCDIQARSEVGMALYDPEGEEVHTSIQDPVEVARVTVDWDLSFLNIKATPITPFQNYSDVDQSAFAARRIRQDPASFNNAYVRVHTVFDRDSARRVTAYAYV
ncbi:hypothetical protein K488DRAFT_90859 [Vararia minispora EC-137]|uniref:Uncharacterized protein n=1 Tax=Vararia minispora EC-137 TaxID=1314806 RepID=A0ACB8Q717_9AGAM|nr:hypothetical protein K488DRAFT_90859 [Vararia minispora EC-137]